MEQTVISLKLPLPPTVNKQYATVGNRRVLSWQARRYKKNVIKNVRRLHINGQIPQTLVSALRQSYISLTLIFYFKNSFGRDLDGGLKITQDSICEALQINDNKVVEIHLLKKVSADEPHVEVKIKLITSWDFRGSFQIGSEAQRLCFDLTREPWRAVRNDSLNPLTPASTDAPRT